MKKSSRRNKFLTDYVEEGLRKVGITVSKPVLAVMCIIFGILLLIFPALVGYIIGIFLLIQGILLLTDYYESNRQQTYRKRTSHTPPPPSSTPPSEQPPTPPPTET
jgi:uncharacterized membrane protein HdeD (DUF308 family)